VIRTVLFAFRHLAVIIGGLSAAFALVVLCACGLFFV
jgi:hypothetical protein